MDNIGKKQHYNAAGTHIGEHDYFGVSEYVYLPASQAGPGRENWFEGKMEREKKNIFPLSRRFVALYFVLLIAVCMGVMLSKASSRAGARNNKNIIQSEINSAKQANAALTREVTAQRDASIIGYKAANRLGMIAADEASVQELFLKEIEMYAGTVERESVVADAEDESYNAYSILLSAR